MTYSVAIESVGHNFAWPLSFWVLECSKFSMQGGLKQNPTVCEKRRAGGLEEKFGREDLGPKQDLAVGLVFPFELLVIARQDANFFDLFF